jgi:hypothetical protein
MKMYIIANFVVGVSTFNNTFCLQKRVQRKSCDYDFIARVSHICSSACAEVAVQIVVVQLASMKARI